MSRPKVLFTEGSSLSARHTLFALGRGYTIDVVDPKFFCQGRFSRFVRRRFSCPSFSHDPVGYLKFLADRIRAERYDVLLPTHDQVFLLSRFRETLSEHVGLALPDFHAIERLQSKAEFVRLLDELNLPQPATTVVCTRQQLLQTDDFPSFIKLAHSTAGRGVQLVKNSGQLRDLVDEWESTGKLDGSNEILIQQPARGIQSTAQAVFQHGRMVGGHTFEARAIGVGGMSSARVSVSRPEVLDQVRRLGAHLDWHGAMFLDYFYDHDTGRPEYIEANPRVGETINAMLSGINLCELLVQVSMGHDVPTTPSGRAGVRTHSGFMILMWHALAGGGRRALLREWWHRQTGQDLYHDSQDELARLFDDPLSMLPAGAVCLGLLARPGSAEDIVNRTVDNYSLPDDAVSTISELSDDVAADCFRDAS